jgi:hypothetical protein
MFPLVLRRGDTAVSLLEPIVAAPQNKKKDQRMGLHFYNRSR